MKPTNETKLGLGKLYKLPRFNTHLRCICVSSLLGQLYDVTKEIFEYQIAGLLSRIETLKHIVIVLHKIYIYFWLLL